MKKISILIPCYNEEASLPLLYNELVKLMTSYTNYAWEVLMVNDGSKDRTLEIIKDLRKKDNRVCYINLSRNFGKEKAMLAGFDYATGDCMVIMDADLQDPPLLIPKMIEFWEQGYEDIYAKRRNRGTEPWLRKKLSLAYYWLLQKTTTVNILQNVGDFRLLDRKCINALKRYRESERYTKGLFCLIGFKKKEVLFDRQDRVASHSSFNFRKLFALSIEGLLTFTTLPLRFATIFGFVTALIGLGFLCKVIFKTLIYGEPVAGYPSLITVIIFLGGVQLLSLGIIGEYIARIFNETKKRPIYLVSEVAGVELTDIK